MDQNNRITVDAHTLIWYIHTESNTLISDNAMSAIVDAEQDGTIYIPIIAMYEILWLIEKQKYPISFDELKKAIKDIPAFKIVPLSYEIMEASEQFKLVEIHDRIIVATSIVTDTDLVSNDLTIRKLYKRVIW